jgi:hypothetical protein
VEAMTVLISPILALIGTLGGALGGTYLGAWLQRKAAWDAQKSLRLERTVEKKTQPIADYLHYASVVLAYQPYIHEFGGLERLPKMIVALYEESVTSMFRAAGPSNVCVSMLADEELTDQMGKADFALRDLMSATDHDTNKKKLLRLCVSGNVAIGNAMACLERVQDRLIQGK